MLFRLRNCDDNGPLELSCGEADNPKIVPNFVPDQAEFSRDPHRVQEARLGLIREELYGSLDEIRIFAERGLVALDVGNDLDLGRAFDQSVKYFLAVAENLKELILVKAGAPQ